MIKLRGEELSKLYPKPKSYEELELERQARAAIRKPTFVSLKISIYAILIPLSLVFAAGAIVMILSTAANSTASALSGVCFSILIGLINFAVIWYISSCINQLVDKIFAIPSLVYVSLLGIFFTSIVVFSILFNAGLLSAVFVILISLITFAVSFMTVELIRRWQE